MDRVTRPRGIGYHAAHLGHCDQPGRLNSNFERAGTVAVGFGMAAFLPAPLPVPAAHQPPSS